MEKSKTFEWIAPDGGFGYVILIAISINLSIYNICINCYGLIYKEYFAELHMNSRDITLLGGVSAMSCSISCFFTGPLLRILSTRKAFLIGAVFFNFGMFCTAFARSKVIFFIFQGFIQNIGTGLIFNISNTVLNEYFVKKRYLAVSITQTVAALSSFIMPQILQLTSQTYGYRGSAIFVCAVSVHAIVAGALMQPISWHLRRVEVSRDENEIKLLVKEGNEAAKSQNDDDIDKTKPDRTLHDEFISNKKHGIKRQMKNLLDFELIKTFTLSIECIGPSLGLVIDVTYLYMLPQALQSYGWNEANMAWAFSLIALGDLLMRIFLILLNKWLNKLGSSKMYIAGMIVTVLARLGISASNSYATSLALFTLIGATRSIVFVGLVLVTSDAVGPDKFSDAIGICMLACGIENLSLAPIIGAIRDYTGNYTIALNIMTAIFAFIALAWIIKLCCFNNTAKRIKENSNKS
ncbi:monocarboxylate transporter 13-like [Colias croceus]|uniref:monocarboxylate transporter 13-like n=1 Tax=Colias crocea TaxID=72248 RepID=UPI001E27A2A0|nr:monocarboxylate transporter 13-like [Colias croceus]